MNKIKKVLAISLIVLGLISSTAIASMIADPMQIGVGARPLGMGKAYVAFAEDGDAIFMNPAGLGKMSSIKLTSMYTSLMGDVNYLVLGGVYPSGPYGAFGAGIISAGVADIPLYTASGISSGTGSWNNSVLFLSYGMDLARQYGWDQPIYGGANLKLYSMGGSGNATIEGAAGSGMDLDLALLYSPTYYADLGLNLQNILPTSLGGKYTTGYGIEESIPANAKFGTKIKLLGKEGQALNVSEYKLNLGIDYDMAVAAKVPGTGHIGMEYWPIENVAVRLGLDQNAGDGGNITNLTAGLGLKYNGIEFDYAYHPYGGIADDTTHYFSLSYVGLDKYVSGLELTVISPSDKTVVYEEKIKVSGQVKGYAKSVTIDGINVAVENGKFESMVPLSKLGKKLVKVQATDSYGKSVNENLRILRLASYSDVGPGYWAKSPIEHTGTVGLIRGYPDGSFRPDRALTRAELATIIIRAKGMEPPPVSGRVFKDLPGEHWAARYVKAAKEHGFVKGYPDGTYKPNKRITKLEGIIVMARIDNLDLYKPVASAPYSDLPVKHWGSKAVSAAKNSGMLSYVSGDNLNPRTDLKRSESVEMLAKTQFASKEIKELLSWFVGYEDTGPQTKLTVEEEVFAQY